MDIIPTLSIIRLTLYLILAFIVFYLTEIFIRANLNKIVKAAYNPFTPDKDD